MSRDRCEEVMKLSNGPKKRAKCNWVSLCCTKQHSKQLGLLTNGVSKLSKTSSQQRRSAGYHQHFIYISLSSRGSSIGGLCASREAGQFFSAGCDRHLVDVDLVRGICRNTLRSSVLPLSGRSYRIAADGLCRAGKRTRLHNGFLDAGGRDGRGNFVEAWAVCCEYLLCGSQEQRSLRPSAMRAGYSRFGNRKPRPNFQCRIRQRYRRARMLFRMRRRRRRNLPSALA